MDLFVCLTKTKNAIEKENNFPSSREIFKSEMQHGWVVKRLFFQVESELQKWLPYMKSGLCL